MTGRAHQGRANARPVAPLAVWAAGRYRHRLGMTDGESEGILRELTDDDSPLVRSSAEFALGEERKG